MEYYSHVAGNRKERVEEHLALTAEYAEKYAGEMGCPNVGRILGLFHDAGKMTERFQDVLKGREFGINHALPGAATLLNDFPNAFEDGDVYGPQVSFGLIRGHHAGLKGNFRPGRHKRAKKAAEDVRSDFEYVEDGKRNAISSKAEYDEMRSAMAREPFETAENLTNRMRGKTPEEKMLFVRLLFSCLVDADYTATGEFEDGEKYASPKTASMKELSDELERYRNELIAGSNANLPINALRNKVYETAREAGRRAEPGLYSMTAPTGTAKTLAMMRFALECAMRNGQRRIFVVLPFLSIIDQTVATYRKAFEKFDVVLEDDGTADYKSEDTDEASYLRLVSEKWDAEIIVTSNVKFYETLFSSKPKNLRKLHSLTNSVVLFDESQTLPSRVMDVTVNVLDSLRDYGVTVLMSTATPPDFGLRNGIRNVPQEIVDDVDGLYSEYERIRKIEISFRKDSTSFEELAKEVEGERQALLIFNTTKKAKRAFDETKKKRPNDAFLLTARMCRAHRQKILSMVRVLVAGGEPCILVATQCVEAGTDVDFPVAYREYAPYPAVVQAMGRCNRNGTGIGRGIVFRNDASGRSGYPDSTYMTESNVTYGIAKNRDFQMSLSDLTALREYYEKTFSEDGPETEDSRELTEAVSEMDFERTDEKYEIIEKEDQTTIIAPYDDGKGTYEHVREELARRNGVVSKRIMRKASPITVNLYADSKKTRELTKRLEPLYANGPTGKRETNWFLAGPDFDGYDDESGLQA